MPIDEAGAIIGSRRRIQAAQKIVLAEAPVIG